MRFGVFDHMDDAGVPLGQLYADRLALAEAYDRAGIYALGTGVIVGTLAVTAILSLRASGRDGTGPRKPVLVEVDETLVDPAHPELLEDTTEPPPTEPPPTGPPPGGPPPGGPPPSAPPSAPPGGPPSAGSRSAGSPSGSSPAAGSRSGGSRPTGPPSGGSPPAQA